MEGGEEWVDEAEDASNAGAAALLQRWRGSQYRCNGHVGSLPARSAATSSEQSAEQ